MTPGQRRAYDDATRYGVDWFVARVAIAESTRAPLPSVRAWPFRDLIAAHAILDVIEAAREKS